MLITNPLFGAAMINVLVIITRLVTVKKQTGFFQLIERLEAGHRVLDIGCGTGVPRTCALTNHFQVTGLDISCQMITRVWANRLEVDLIVNE